jgi:hypothetical protein
VDILVSILERSLGYEFLSYLSNKLFHTKTDYIKFIYTTYFITSTNNYVDNHFTEILSNMNTDNISNVSQEIYSTIILHDSSRFYNISSHYLGNNLYSNFLLPNDILYYKISISPPSEQSLDLDGNVIPPRTYLFSVKLI